MVEGFEPGHVSLGVLIFLFFVSVIVGIYGSIFGGGSFVIQPLLLALGIPPHMVVAHDVSASTGIALSGAYVFRKNKYVAFDIVKWWLPGIVLGPLLGIQLLVYMPAWLVEKLIAVFCITGCLYVLFFHKQMMAEEQLRPENWKLRAVLCSFVVGIYFGFSGAGAGTLTSLLLFTLFGLGLRHTLGTRKFIHLPIHVIGTAGYAWFGLIYWPLFLSMFLGCLVAGWVGSVVALKIPEHILKPVFFTIVMVLGFSILL